MSDMQNDATAQTNFGRSEQKRHTILQSAEELFLTRGFNGTSMDEVAVHRQDIPASSGVIAFGKGPAHTGGRFAEYAVHERVLDGERTYDLRCPVRAVVVHEDDFMEIFLIKRQQPRNQRL